MQDWLRQLPWEVLSGLVLAGVLGAGKWLWPRARKATIKAVISFAERHDEKYLQPAITSIRKDDTGKAIVAFACWHVAMFGANLLSTGVWIVVAMLLYQYGHVYLAVPSFGMFLYQAYCLMVRFAYLYATYDTFVGAEIEKVRTNASTVQSPPPPGQPEGHDRPESA